MSNTAPPDRNNSNKFLPSSVGKLVSITGLTRKKKKRTIPKSKTNLWQDNGEASSKQRVSFVALIVFALGVLLFAGSLFVWLKLQKNDIANTPQLVLPSVLESNGNAPPVFSSSPEIIAKAFAQTPNPEERLQWVINPEQTKEHWTSYSEEALSAVTTITPIGNTSIQGRIFSQYYASFGNDRYRIICVTPTPDGPKVDWDAYARYSTSSWKDILSGAVKEAQVRAVLAPSHYYNHQYRDDSIWTCYQLTSQDLKKPLLVYARNDSKTGQALSSVLPSTATKPIPMTLSLRSENDGHVYSQYTITRIYALSWALAEKDFEDVWVPSLIEVEEPESKLTPSDFGLPE